MKKDDKRFDQFLDDKDFGFECSKDLESRFLNLYELIKKLNKYIKNKNFIEAIYQELINNPEFLNTVSEKLLASGQLVDALLGDENFLNKVVEITTNNLMNNKTFIDAITVAIEKDQDFLKMVQQWVATELPKDQNFINEIANLVSQNQGLINQLVQTLSSNQTLITALEKTITADQTFINNLVTLLVSNQTLIDGLVKALAGNQELITALKTALAGDNDFINQLSKVLVANQDFLNQVIAGVSADPNLIKSLTDAISKDQNFLNSVATSTFNSLVASKDFIKAISDQIAIGGTVTKDYVDTQDAATLTSAKSYTDTSMTNNVGDVTQLKTTAKVVVPAINELLDNKAKNIPDPVNSTDTANKEYVDQFAAFKFNQTDKTFDYLGDSFDKLFVEIPVNMKSQRITNLLKPTNPQDAATKSYVDNNFEDNTAFKYVDDVKSYQYVLKNLKLDMNGSRIRNVPLTAINDDELTSKNYVDEQDGITLQSAKDYTNASQPFNSLEVAQLNAIIDQFWIEQNENQKWIAAGILTPFDFVTSDDTTKKLIHIDAQTIQLYETQNYKNYLTSRDKLTLNNVTNNSARVEFNPTNGKLSYWDGTKLDEVATKGQIPTPDNIWTNVTGQGKYQLTKPLDLNNQQITNLKDPTSAIDVATKGYVDQFAAFKLSSDTGWNYTGNGGLGLNNKKITMLAAPTSNTDASNKQYVDNANATTLASAKSYTDTNSVGANYVDDLRAISKRIMVNPTGEVNINYPLVVGFPQEANTIEFVIDSKEFSVLNTNGQKVLSITDVFALLKGADEKVQFDPSDGTLTYFNTNIFIKKMDEVATVKDNPFQYWNASTETYDYKFKGSKGLALSSMIITDLGDPIKPDDATTKKYVDTKVQTEISDFVKDKHKNIPEPTDQLDAVNKQYADKYGGFILNPQKEVIFASDRYLNMKSRPISGLADPSGSTDAVNKRYVDSKIKTHIEEYEDHVKNHTAFKFDPEKNAFVHQGEGYLSINDQQLRNIAPPTASNDAANKKYVDQKAQTTAAILIARFFNLLKSKNPEVFYNITAKDIEEIINKPVDTFD